MSRPGRLAALLSERTPGWEEVPGLGGWEPSELDERDVVTEGAAAALHGLLGAPGAAPAEGQPLPPLWHWLAFLPRVAHDQLGPDGHPRKGGFLPPVALPRRMFVGGEVGRGDPGALRVGRPLRRVGRVEGIEAKAGRSGELVFVTVGYRIESASNPGAAGPAGAGIGAGVGVATAGPRPGIDERQRLVYRPAAAVGRLALSPASSGPTPVAEGGTKRDGPGPDDARWTMGFELPVDPTLLFRFSALTYNAHRIHYDRAWATEEEGYPGLVVHGPLQALALADLCRRHHPSRPVTGFDFRALQPAFDDGPLRLRGCLDGPGGQVELVAFDHRGRRTMSATCRLAAG